MQGHTFGTGFMIALVACLLLMPMSWAQPPKAGGTLRVAYEADITGLDPHVSFGLQAWYVAGSLFNSLVTIDAELNVVPDLAEAWEILDDGKVYVFRLHKGVKFHDGTDFDAEAVQWNYRRLVDPEEKTLDAPYYNIVEAVDVLDAHTVKFTFKHPTRTLLPVMAADRAGFLQMSPASYKQWGKEEVRLHPAGTGPFKLAKWEQNQIIVLEKNPHYFKPGLPYLDRIELRIMKEGVTRVTALRAGEVDFANYVPRESIERLSRDPQLYVVRGDVRLRGLPRPRCAVQTAGYRNRPGDTGGLTAPDPAPHARAGHVRAHLVIRLAEWARAAGGGPSADGDQPLPLVRAVGRGALEEGLSLGRCVACKRLFTHIPGSRVLRYDRRERANPG